MAMVLEATVSPHDVERVIVDTFGESDVSLVATGDAIVLTRASAGRVVSGLTMASEGVLAKEWLSPEEDEAWGFL
ncbi:MAG: hypothetical protein FWC23_03860 [Chitinispirillia bacterium]|nr:hypothetical protein [Chitinispirillia bacterium]MCL2268307.1 hypothetical protein [Chitinispirillia bacterium]